VAVFMFCEPGNKELTGLDSEIYIVRSLQNAGMLLELV